MDWEGSCRKLRGIEAAVRAGMRRVVEGRREERIETLRGVLGSIVVVQSATRGCYGVVLLLLRRRNSWRRNI